MSDNTEASPAVKSKSLDPANIRIVNGHKKLNGLIHMETHGTASSTEKTSSAEESSRHHPHKGGACVNGNGPHKVFRVPETVPIVRKLFHGLLSGTGIEVGVLEALKVSEHALKRQSKSQLICRVADLTSDYIKTSDRSLESFIEDLTVMGFDVQETTVYSEFRKVTAELFSDTINFGRVISFLRFSAAYAVLMYRKGVRQAVPSIEAWTVEVLEEDLGKFFQENKGWVSVLVLCVVVNQLVIACNGLILVKTECSKSFTH